MFYGLFSARDWQGNLGFDGILFEGIRDKRFAMQNQIDLRPEYKGTRSSPLVKPLVGFHSKNRQVQSESHTQPDLG